MGAQLTRQIKDAAKPWALVFAQTDNLEAARNNEQAYVASRKINGAQTGRPREYCEKKSNSGRFLFF